MKKYTDEQLETNYNKFIEALKKLIPKLSNDIIKEIVQPSSYKIQ